MSDEPFAAHDSEINEVERALLSIVPSPTQSRLDRDRIMFRCGQASVRPAPRASVPGRRGWMALAASFGLLASGEGVLLATRPASVIVEKHSVVGESARLSTEPTPEQVIVVAPSSLLSSPSISPRRLDRLGQTAHERMASQIFRYGLDGLPRSLSASWGDSEPAPIASRQQLQEELRTFLVPGDPT